MRDHIGRVSLGNASRAAGDLVDNACGGRLDRHATVPTNFAGPSAARRLISPPLGREPSVRSECLIGMRRRFRGLVALAAASAALFLAACGADESSPPDRGRGSAAWQEVPAGPLSPREGALGLWTGREVLLIGGSDARPCPPNAECVVPDVPPLADGAAFDPRTREWHRIAEASLPFEWAQGLVVGTTAYLWVPGSPDRPDAAAGFLAYHIEKDRWEELPLPPGDLGWLQGIVQAGDRIVAYRGSDEQGEQPDFVFDPATSFWSELPPDPLSPSFDRSMAWSGRELLLFEHELVPNPGADEPALTRAAALDPESGSWRRLPDSGILATGPWVMVDGRLVNPTLGGADGGDDGWGRTYPYGGILDPASGEWSALPNRPGGEEDWGSGVLTEPGGVLTDSGGHYLSYRGWILDTSDNAWIEITPLDTGELVTGRTVVAAGTNLLVFGGARWKANNRDYTLLNEAWIWPPTNGTPPRSEPSPLDAFPAAKRYAREALGWTMADPEACFLEASCLAVSGEHETVYVYRSIPCPDDGTRACEVAVVDLRRLPTGDWTVTRCEFLPRAPLRRGARACREEAPSAPERVTNEQALRLIRSCHVTEFRTLHSGETRLTLVDGRSVYVIQPDNDALLRAGSEAQWSGCETALGTEERPPVAANGKARRSPDPG
jgi:hypothetical protein